MTDLDIDPRELEPEEGADKLELWRLCTWALTNRAKEVEMIPINYCFKEGARQNDKRPAYISFFCPDDWTLNLVKNEKLLDGFVALRIPREHIQEFIVGESLGHKSNAPVPLDSPVLSPVGDSGNGVVVDDIGSVEGIQLA